MTIRDEIIDALEGHGDTHPPAIFTQSGTVEQMDGCGAAWPEAHSDPAKMATLALQVSEKCGFGTVRIPFNITNDSVAFGGVERGLVKESQPTIGSSPFMGDGDFLDVPDDFLSVDEFMANPRIQAMLETANQLARRDDLFFTTSLNAPLAAIDNILGVENVLMALFMDPDRVTKWLAAVTPHLTAYGKALSETSDMVMYIEEADAEILPPDCFQPVVGDFLPKLISAADSFTAIHTCGTTTDIAKDLASLGETLLSPEASHDMAGYKALVGDSVKLAGAVNPVKTLFQGTPADIVAEAKASAAAGFDIITPECGVPPLTPNENLIALAKYREL